MQYKLILFEILLALAILLGSGVTAWTNVKSDYARMDQRVATTEERLRDGSARMVKSTESFTASIKELTNVMQEMSVSFGRMDERLGGVEVYLRDIRSKI